jgi:hypothetical protein
MLFNSIGFESQAGMRKIEGGLARQTYAKLATSINPGEVRGFGSYSAQLMNWPVAWSAPTIATSYFMADRAKRAPWEAAIDNDAKTRQTLREVSAPQMPLPDSSSTATGQGWGNIHDTKNGPHQNDAGTPEVKVPIVEPAPASPKVEVPAPKVEVPKPVEPKSAEPAPAVPDVESPKPAPPPTAPATLPKTDPRPGNTEVPPLEDNSKGEMKSPLE